MEPTKEIEAVKSEVQAILNSAQALVIKDPTTYQAAGGILVNIATKAKRVKEFFEPMKKAAAAAHKAICDQEKTVLDPLAALGTKIKSGLTAYDYAQEQERRRREDEERQRRMKEEEEKRLSEASAMEAAGDAAAASDHLAKPVTVEPVVLQKETPKVEGVSFRENWSFRIVNEAAIPREFMVADLKKIGAYAKAMKSAGKIEGVEIYSERNVTTRAAVNMNGAQHVPGV